MDPRSLDDLARRLAAAVPPGVAALRRDLEDNFKAVLQAGLSKLDLVSRRGVCPCRIRGILSR